MIADEAHRGARDAAARFNVREGSAFASILGALGAGVGGSVARGAINAVSPRLMSTFENLGAAPVNAARRAFAGPSSPADLLVKHLGGAQPAMRTPGPMPAMIGAPTK